MKNSRNSIFVRATSVLLVFVMLFAFTACKQKFSTPTEQFVAALDEITTIEVNEKGGKDEVSAPSLDITAFDNKRVSLAIQPVISETLTTMLGANLPVDISVINNTKICFDAAMKGDAAKLGLSLGYGDSTLAAVSGILDIANLGAYVDLSVGSDKALFFDLKTILENTYGSIDTEAVGLANPTPTFTQEEAVQFATAISEYVKMTYAGVADVASEEKSYTVGTLSADVTALTWKATDKVVYDTAIAIAEKFVADENLKAVSAKIFGSAYPDFDAMYTELVNGAKDFLESEKADPVTTTGAEVLTVVLYVDENNEILGVDVLAYEEDGANVFSMTFGNLNVGDDFAFEISVSGAEFPNVALSAHGTDVKDVLNATVSVSYDGKQLAAITLKDCDSSKADKGITKGSVSVRPGSGISSLPGIEPSTAIAIGMFGLKFDYDTTENKSEYFISVEMNSANLAGVKLTVENGEAQTISIPTDYVSEPSVWVMSLDLNEIATAIKNAELPEEIEAMLLSMLNMQ